MCMSASAALCFPVLALCRFGITLVLFRFPALRFATLADTLLQQLRFPFRGPRYGRFSKDRVKHFQTLGL